MAFTTREIESPDPTTRVLAADARARESLGDIGEKMVLNMGPSHPATHGVLRLVLELDGETITKATGGLCFFPKTLEEVDALALEVAKDIRNQYVIGYTPTVQDLDGTFRAIRVTANGPNRPTVRTRSGYYAAPQKTVARPGSNSLLGPKE